jgi:hypothetical protein
MMLEGEEVVVDGGFEDCDVVCVSQFRTFSVWDGVRQENEPEAEAEPSINENGMFPDNFALAPPFSQQRSAMEVWKPVPGRTV